MHWDPKYWLHKNAVGPMWFGLPNVVEEKHIGAVEQLKSYIQFRSDELEGMGLLKDPVVRAEYQGRTKQLKDLRDLI